MCISEELKRQTAHVPPLQQNTFREQWRSDWFIQKFWAPAASTQLRKGFLEALNYRFALSMVCWHILRLPWHCDLGCSWEGRVSVAAGFLCSTEENNQNISLGREYRQQGMCKAILFLPSASAGAQAWCFWTTVFIGPARPVLHKGTTPFEKLFVLFCLIQVHWRCPTFVSLNFPPNPSWFSSHCAGLSFPGS